MVNFNFDGRHILITKSLRKIVIDLINEKNFSGNDEMEFDNSPKKKYYIKKFK